MFLIVQVLSIEWYASKAPKWHKKIQLLLKMLLNHLGKSYPTVVSTKLHKESLVSGGTEPIFVQNWASATIVQCPTAEGNSFQGIPC